MSRNQIPEQSRRETSAGGNEYRVYMGKLEGVVRPHEDRYWFFVRDTARDGPIIHGFGVDFQKAVAVVERLVDVLHAGAQHQTEVKQGTVPAAGPPDPRIKRAS